MFETFLTAFTTFFAVIGPIDTAVLLASLTPNMTGAERRAIAAKAVFIATVIILLFALVGQPVLTQLGVSLAALQTAGGIILFIIALEMTLAIVLAAGTKGDLSLLGAVIAAILAVMAVTLLLLLTAQEIHQLIGVTARKVIVRVFGVLLAALAVQSIFNGLAEAHIFG